MKLKFDFSNVMVTEFGVGLDEMVEQEKARHKPPPQNHQHKSQQKPQQYVAVPTDDKVKKALRDVVTATLEELQNDKYEPHPYEPSEKHEATAHLALPLRDELAVSIRQLHEANQLPLDVGALNDPSLVFCYFTRLIDAAGNRLTAVRRATLFKGVLKSRLIHIGTDSLTLIGEQVFKLDREFDLVADSDTIHILHPSGFEYVGMLQEAILRAVPENVRSIRKNLGFVNLDPIAVYAGMHPRAARLLASIRSQPKNINRTALQKLCKNSGVKFTASDGRIAIDPGDELDFLEVLDRRRYQVELVKGAPERFRANSRQKL